MNKMRFMLYALIAVFTTTLTSCSDDDDRNRFENLPVAVQKAFSEKYPESRVYDWKKKDVYYVIDFKIGKTDAEAWFENNLWKMTERDDSFNNLPALVSKAFKSGPYSEWLVDDVDVVERDGMQTLYVIEVEKGKVEVGLYYFENGTLLKEVVDDDRPSSYLPQVPSKLSDALKELYPGAVILDAEFEKGVYELDIVHENVKKEVRFDKDFKWLDAKWDVLKTDLPNEVLNFIEKNYPGYDIDEAEFVINSEKESFYVIELEKGDEEITIKVSQNGEPIK